MQEHSVVQALLLTLNFVVLGLVAAVLCRRVRPHRRVITTFLLLLTLCALLIIITCVPVVLQIELGLVWRILSSFLGGAFGFVVLGKGFHGKRIH